MGLRFKILIGYSILITLLVFIVYLFRQEQIKHNTLTKSGTGNGLYPQVSGKDVHAPLGADYTSRTGKRMERG